ncbi:hypothetical protein [Nostoc sp.]
MNKSGGYLLYELIHRMNYLTLQLHRPDADLLLLSLTNAGD